MQQKPVYVTERGFRQIESDLRFLRDVKRPEMVDRLQEAREGGDWMDNAECQLVQNELAFTDGRIHELENMLQNACLIQAGEDKGKVEIGDTVMIQPVDAPPGRGSEAPLAKSRAGLHSATVTAIAPGESELERYTIVGVAEADPTAGLISNECPLAQALLNRRVGEEVTVVTPAGATVVRVVAVL
jgi:transcription elongation factor GreA